MMLPIDPIMSLVVIVAVFVYFTLRKTFKAIGSADDKSIYDIFREIGEQSTEYKRYQERLNDNK